MVDSSARHRHDDTWDTSRRDATGREERGHRATVRVLVGMLPSPQSIGFAPWR